MMPELAQETDTEQLWHESVHSGIDLIETDHAPHSYESKMAAEQGSGECKGVPGGEFTQPLILRRTLKKEDGYERMPMDRYVELTSGAAQRLLNISLSPKTQATWEMEEFRYETEEPGAVESGAKWNPFLGMMAAGKLVKLQIGDKVVVDNKALTGQKAGKVVTGNGEVI
jgi:dihydroorotase